MPTSDRFDISQAFGQAQHLLSQERYPEAIAICRGILQRDSNFTPAFQILGKAHQMLGALDVAQQWYEKSLSVDANQPQVYLALGNVCVRRQQWERGAICYQKALQQAPNLTPAYRNLVGIWNHLERPLAIAEKLIPNIGFAPPEFSVTIGDTLSKNNQIEAALSVYQIAIAMEPKWAAVHYKMGVIYFKSNQIELAVEAFQKAVEFAPEISTYYMSLGQALEAVRRYEDAIAAYQKSAELKPDFSWSYHHLGRTLEVVGRTEEAVEAYRRDVALNPSFYWSHFHLGNLLQKQGLLEEAIAAYREAVAINPEQPEAHQRIADILWDRSRGEEALLSGNYEDAIAIYQNIIADRPDYSWGYYGLGLALLKQEKWAAARDAFEQAIALNPDSFWPHNNLGYCWFRQGEIDRAIAEYREAIAIDAEIPEAHVRLGDALLLKNDVDGAIFAYLEAIRVQPDKNTAYLKLRHMRTYSFVELKPEQVEAIATGYKQAIAASPDSPEPYINYGDLLTQDNQIETAISIYDQGMLQKTQFLRPEFFQNDWKTASVKKPHFLILGAQKGGTTSLYEYLCQHPQVIPNLHKEVDFFNLQYDLGLNWYLAHFPPLPEGGKWITGEASPSYMINHKVIDRVYEAFPDIRLICILRNPVKRAFSQYQNHVNWMGQEHRSFERAIADEIAIIETLDDIIFAGDKFWKSERGYILRGMYVYFLEQWMNRFPSEQMLILRSEDLYGNPQQTLKQVFEFLGIPDHPLSEYKKYTAGSYSAMPQSVQETLSEFLKPHNQKLEEFLGRKFNWD